MAILDITFDQGNDFVHNTTTKVGGTILAIKFDNDELLLGANAPSEQVSIF